jgi:CRISPR-associated protein Csh2
VVYATDKALKFALKNYIKNIEGDDKLLYIKRLNEEFNPLDLPAAYNETFKSEVKNDDKKKIVKNLLSKIDVKLFGATFAPKGDGIKDKNISIHGPVQVNHGQNIWKENNIFSEQILSPFANPNKKKDESGEEIDKTATSAGRQSKLQEGHYLHHFSINPKNLSEVVKLTKDENLYLQDSDITILKDALRSGVTYYDSAAKAGTDNEFLLWVKLNETSKTVLPNFSSLIKLEKDDKGKVVIDLTEFSKVFEKNKAEIEAVEIFYLAESNSLKGEPTEKTSKYDLTSGQ